jgi:hypothetical protein
VEKDNFLRGKRLHIPGLRPPIIIFICNYSGICISRKKGCSHYLLTALGLNDGSAKRFATCFFVHKGDNDCHECTNTF